ncbi:hypothetical protein C8F01DRAFT_1114625 [Mycena amicta]|nr:hypothetical protein C8F01DRAFT_1114625 [Mycena amicta]
MSTYSPGPLLRPGDIDESGQFIPVQCFGDAALVDLSFVKYVQVQKRGLIFCSEQRRGIFEKRFGFMDIAFQTNARKFQRVVELPACPRIRDDILVQLFLTDENATLFNDAIRTASPPEGRRGELPALIYLLQEQHVATLLPLHHPLYDVINHVLTLLAFTDLADIFGPIVHWSVAPSPNLASQQQLARATIHQWLQNTPPPRLVVTFGEGDIEAKLNNVKFDEAGSGKFPEDVVTLSEICEAWPLKSYPEPQIWFRQLVSDYGVHIRRRDTLDQTIVLNWDLIRWFGVAHAAASRPGAPERDHLSLASVEASLRVTIAHELSHVYVTQRHPSGDSPPRTQVGGVRSRRWDDAEDPHRQGMIEAGNLLESAWLGAKHCLGVGTDRSLRFLTTFIAVGSSESNSDSEEFSRASPELSSHSIPTSSSPPSSQSLCNIHSDLVRSFMQTPETSDSDSDSDSDSSSGERLGSPIQLGTVKARTFVSHEEALQELVEPDRILNVVVWTRDMLDGIWSAASPPPESISPIRSPAVYIRNRQDRTPNPSGESRNAILTPKASKPTRLPLPVAPKSEPRGMLLVSQANRWPSVVGRSDGDTRRLER